MNNSPLDSKSVSNLVELHDGKAVTDSCKVAGAFDREHFHVMRDIKTLECSDKFSQSNFGWSDYENERGKIYPICEMTRDGFTFLAMGFTGAKAAKWKEAYITAFNKMEEQLRDPSLNAVPDAASLDQLTAYLQTRLMDGRLIHGTTLELQQLLRIVENLNGVENGYNIPKLPKAKTKQTEKLPFGFRQLLDKSTKLSDELRNIEAVIENARRINATLYSEIEYDLMVANGAKVVEEPKHLKPVTPKVLPAPAISPPQTIELSASGVPYFRASPKLHNWFKAWLRTQGTTQAAFCRQHDIPHTSLAGALRGDKRGPHSRRLKTQIKNIVQRMARDA